VARLSGRLTAPVAPLAPPVGPLLLVVPAALPMAPLALPVGPLLPVALPESPVGFSLPVALPALLAVALCYDCAWLSLTALSTVTCNLWL
jgi:hypothetical protein